MPNLNTYFVPVENAVGFRL